MTGIYIFLADGFEDIEALACYDILRRGGTGVRLVSLNDDLQVLSAHGLTVNADITLDMLPHTDDGTTAGDFMIFPGGMPGAARLAACSPLMEKMKAHYAAGGSIAAICAAPGLVLPELGDVCNGLKFTCYDGFEQEMEALGAVHLKQAVVRDRRIITGRGPGYALDFSYEILAAARGEAFREDVRKAMFLG